MDARRRKLAGATVVICAAIGVAATACFSGRAPLSPQEQACVGSWTFVSSTTPTTQFVYHLAADGSACEEHYYLTSATPTVARLRMLGQWRVERDGQLVVEASGGGAGLATETMRLIRNACGDQQYDFGMLRRIFTIKNVDTDGISVTASRSGGGGREEIVMAPFVAPLHR